jgi:hypothetical protein
MTMHLRHLLVLALAASAAAAAQDYPTLKTGQWEMTVAQARQGASPMRSTLCIDDSVQKQMAGMSAGMNKDMCPKLDVRRDGARYVTDAECKLGESKLKSRAVMTMLGETGYKTEITSTYDPPFMGMKDAQTTVEGKYVGACRNGLVPGDIVTPSGQKFNVKNLPDLKSKSTPAK